MKFNDVYNNILRESVIFNNNTIFIPRRVTARYDKFIQKNLNELYNDYKKNPDSFQLRVAPLFTYTNHDKKTYSIDSIPSFIKQLEGLSIIGNLFKSIPDTINFVHPASLSIYSNRSITSLPNNESIKNINQIYLSNVINFTDFTNPIFKTLPYFDINGGTIEKIVDSVKCVSTNIMSTRIKDLYKNITISHHFTITNCVFEKNNVDINISSNTNSLIKKLIVTFHNNTITGSFKGSINFNMLSQITFKNMDIKEFDMDINCEKGDVFFDTLRGLQSIKGKIKCKTLTINYCKNLKLSEITKNIDCESLNIKHSLEKDYTPEEIVSYFN